MTEITGSCECGASHLRLTRCPTRRIFCHCTICQAAYRRDFADLMVTHPKTVALEPGHMVEFRTFKSLPPVARRGICTGCDKPVISLLPVMPGLTFAVFPASMLEGGPCQVMPSFHIFYGTRVRDIDDELPKYNGFVSSYVMTTPAMLKALAGK